MNSSLLHDEAFSAEIREFWFSWQLQNLNFHSLAVWLDAGKVHLKHKFGSSLGVELGIDDLVYVLLKTPCTTYIVVKLMAMTFVVS